MIRQTWKAVVSLWEDDEAADPILYDPVHVAAVVVGCLFALGIVFWDLWALLVFEGGFLTKAMPFFQVILTSKTLKDFGYEGSPYALGIFEGWIVNLTALFIGLFLVAAIGWVLRHALQGGKPRH
ncbi:MAG: hypothetical protein IPN90_06435 [Elusimicrobia bacterium]|nr:hypothetical protein [Elusimicrobiota bacterium]